MSDSKIRIGLVYAIGQWRNPAGDSLISYCHWLWLMSTMYNFTRDVWQGETLHGESLSWLNVCEQCREHGRVVPASWHQPGRSRVQVHGQRFPSDHQWFHVGNPPPPLCRATSMSNFCGTSPQLFFAPFDRYFRKGCYFGLACFANMPVESELERGARMKSVGILCPSYTLLYRYMHFLENQVRLDAFCVVCVCTHHISWHNLPSNVSTSCHCSFVPMFFHPLNMNKETQLQLFSHTQGFCVDALTACPFVTILLLSFSPLI